MKKKLFTPSTLLILGMLSLFSACNNDDDGTNKAQEIAGKYWKISFASLLSPPFICIIISRMVLRCPLGVFPAPAFVADFPPVAPEFHQRTHRVRLRNLGTTDKKSSHKIRHRKIPREPIKTWEVF